MFHYHSKTQLTTVVQYTVSSTTVKAVVVVMETHLSDIKVAFGTKYYYTYHDATWTRTIWKRATGGGCYVLTFLYHRRPPITSTRYSVLPVPPVACIRIVCDVLICTIMQFFPPPINLEFFRPRTTWGGHLLVRRPVHFYHRKYARSQLPSSLPGRHHWLRTGQSNSALLLRYCMIYRYDYFWLNID